MGSTYFLGAFFGIGQLCFAYAIKNIGIALSFTTNLGIDVMLGSWFVLFYHHSFFSYHGLLVNIAVAIIAMSLCFFYYCGKSKATIVPNSYYLFAWGLAAMAGVASGLQNASFIIVLSYHMQTVNEQLAFWIWLPFLASAGLVMSCGFAYQAKKRINTYWSNLKTKNIILISIMSLCFTGSLALYSLAMHALVGVQQAVGWPLLMLSIILATQFWSYIYREAGWLGYYLLYRCIGVGLLIAAIFILSLIA